MTLFKVQKHFTESDDPDDVSLWPSLGMAQAEYDACVKRYRAIGASEVETVGVDLAENADERYAFARTVFRNMDDTKTVFTLSSIRVPEAKERRNELG